MKKYEYKYHYVYSITNNKNGRLYCGVHSTNNLDDEFFGSGALLKAAIARFGRKAFTMNKSMCDNRNIAYKKLDELKNKTKTNKPGVYKNPLIKTTK